MLYHSTSLVVQNKGILLRGKSGSGKSDLALRLIKAGAILIADDQTDIIQEKGRLVARAPEALQGKLEVRGIGIIDVPFCPEHVLDIIIDLKPWQTIERFPLDNISTIEGISLPYYEIDPFEASALEKLFVISQL